MNADLQQFVRDCLARGIARDAIRTQLTGAGWRAEEIDAALAAWAEGDFPVPVPRRRVQVSAREAFLYLVLFVTLYVTAWNVGALLFQLIERWLPDPAFAAPGAGGRFNARWLRDSVAALMIAWPVHLYLSRFVGRMLRRDPEKRGSGVRRWLTYITLFVAALVILGDLTFVVARLLSGEIPPRFLARTLVVLLIAGYVFGRYLTDLRREEDEKETGVRAAPSLLPRIAGVAVACVIAVSLWAAGSPRTARFEEIDARRVRELQQLNDAIETYYRERRALPPALDSLKTVPTVYVESLLDPVTHQPYGYAVTGAERYELCATFDASDLGDPRPGPSSPYGNEPRPSFWRHAAGRHCYALLLPRGVVEAMRAAPAAPPPK